MCNRFSLQLTLELAAIHCIGMDCKRGSQHQKVGLYTSCTRGMLSTRLGNAVSFLQYNVRLITQQPKNSRCWWQPSQCWTPPTWGSPGSTGTSATILDLQCWFWQFIHLKERKMNWSITQEYYLTFLILLFIMIIMTLWRKIVQQQQLYVFHTRFR